MLTPKVKRHQQHFHMLVVRRKQNFNPYTFIPLFHIKPNRKLFSKYENEETKLNLTIERKWKMKNLTLKEIETVSGGTEDYVSPEMQQFQEALEAIRLLTKHF